MGVHYPNLVKSFAPSLYWRLNEGATATAATDYSGNGLAGTYSGGATPGTAAQLAYAPGAGSATFNSGYVGVASAAAINPDYNLTVCLLANYATASNPNQAGWVSKFSYGTPGWAILGGNNGTVYLYLATSGGFQTIEIDNGTLADQTPRHYAFAFSKIGSIYGYAYYRDGVLRGNGTYSGGGGFGAAAGNANSLIVGACPGVLNAPQARFSEVSLFSATLTATQIAALSAASGQKFLPRRRGPGRRAA